MNAPSVEALRESNAERARKLAREGVLINILSDVGWAVKFRVDVLTDYLFATSEDAAHINRDDFELHYERAVEEVLAAAEGEVHRAKLTAGLGQGVQLSLGDASA